MKIRNVLLRFFISAFASLPFWIVYPLSNVLAFVSRNIIRYRRDIVYTNLKNSFPEKNKKEIRKIDKHFYKNLSDLALETFKSSKMDIKDFEKRVVFTNKEILDDLFYKNKNVFATLGHCGNWEWVGNKIALFLKHEGGAIYKPIHDQFFDDYMVGIRQKYKGTLMINYKKVFRTLLSLKDKLFTVFVLADQSPARTEMDYYIEFLNQKTAFYEGVEKVARALNYAVVYLDIKRTGRGYYKVEIIPITENARETEEEYITKKYVRLLEESIKSQPDNWLWSHRRWKNREEN